MLLRLNSTLLIASVGIIAVAAACSDDDPGNNGGGGASQAGASGKAGSAATAGRAGALDTAGASGSEAAGEAGAGGDSSLGGSAGPTDVLVNEFHHPVGSDAAHGRDTFRFETFGNEGFWTRTLRLPQGIASSGLTTAGALKLGLNIDIDSVPTALRAKITAEAKTNLSLKNAPLLNDPATFIALLEANSVVGFPARNVKTLNGTLDIDDTDVFAGESVGMACSLCHAITDGSVYSLPHSGGIGKRVDGLPNHDLNFGATIALGEASRAFYPGLALDLVANKHMSVSRKGVGVALISKAATEKEVDAFLNDPELYPVGMFDDAPDGNAAPLKNANLFRTDLAAPWGTDGSIEQLQNFNNLVYTALMDPTDLTTVGGRRFMFDRGVAAGTEIVDNYVAILADLGVPAEGTNGYPFVGRPDNPLVAIGLPAGAKVEDTLIGMRVDDTALFDMNLYLNSLPAPAGVKTNAAAIARGREVFRSTCTTCHNDDQSRFVPPNIVPFNDTVELFENAPPRPALLPAYKGVLVADRSASRLVPARDSVGIFDDKWIIVDASVRNQPRGSALPQLLDLARKPNFLHDSSVATLADLLDPARGKNEPHPFFVADAAERDDVVAFLESLDDQGL
ncbi:MAG: hypothetical protein ABUL62_17070 [Myxococcales bacterium]